MIKMFKNKKGEEGGFQSLLFGLILTGLFGMLILTAVINYGNEYSKDISILGNGSLSLDKFNQSISDVKGGAENVKAVFSGQSVWSAIAGVVVEGIFKIVVGLFTMMLFPFSLITGIMENVLGIPTFVTYTITGLLIFSIIFSIWRLIKIGD